MVATLASQFFIVWVIDKFGWFKNYDVSGSTTFQKIFINGVAFTSGKMMYLLVACNCGCYDVDLQSIWHVVQQEEIGWLSEIWTLQLRRWEFLLLKTKLQAFAINAFLCGIGGVLYCFTYLKSSEPFASFNISLSFKIMFMAIVGGLGTVTGAFIGAAFILAFSSRS